jgi:hypothetical protein
VHDRAYFDLLYREKKCQRGNVVFCFDGEIEEKNFLGFFAYSMEGEDMYVERYLWKKECNYGFVGKRQNCNRKQIHVIEQFPYMLRIVNMDIFLNLFKNYFVEFVLEKKVLSVKDTILSGNNGMYCFYEKNGMIQVNRQTEMDGKHNFAESRNEVVTMTVREIADYALMKVKEKQDGIFFAEVV